MYTRRINKKIYFFAIFLSSRLFFIFSFCLNPSFSWTQNTPYSSSPFISFHFLRLYIYRQAVVFFYLEFNFTLVFEFCYFNRFVSALFFLIRNVIFISNITGGKLSHRLKRIKVDAIFAAKDKIDLSRSGSERD